MSEKLDFDYYYGKEAEQYTFYRIPKALFKDECFSSLSTDAKVLYGLMLDRMGLSMKNNWVDEENRVYIIFQVSEIMSDLNCAEQKANKLLSELDVAKGIGLIERRRQGLGKPNIIYVKSFVLKSQIKNCENHKSGNVKITSQELRKSQTNNTNINNTDFNDIQSINLSRGTSEYDTGFLVSREDEVYGMDRADEMDEIDERSRYRKIVLDNIEYDSIKNSLDTSLLLELVEIMVDTICGNQKYICVGGSEIPKEVVKSQLLKLNATHIEYVVAAIKNNTTKVRNIRNYLITTLYNAPLTINHYYMAEVNHDLYGQKYNRRC